MKRVLTFKTEEAKQDFISNNCPSDCGIPDSDCTISCEKCWARDYIELIVEEKETKEMPEKKTKAELEQEIKELQKQVKDLERYKGYQDAADEIAAMREAFKNSGFSDEESFTLVSGMVDNVIGAAIRRLL